MTFVPFVHVQLGLDKVTFLVRWTIVQLTIWPIDSLLKWISGQQNNDELEYCLIFLVQLVMFKWTITDRRTTRGRCCLAGKMNSVLGVNLTTRSSWTREQVSRCLSWGVVSLISLEVAFPEKTHFPEIYISWYENFLWSHFSGKIHFSGKSHFPESDKVPLEPPNIN